MKPYKILLTFFMCLTLSFANSLTQKELYEQNFSINKGAFKIVEFEKMVKNIKVSSEEFLEVDFLDNTANPLKGIKIFAKTIGNGNILITFSDESSMLININIVENLTTTINVAKQISPNIIIKQTNGKIILEGSVQEQKTKDKILNLFEKSGIDLKKDLVDLLTLENPAKMIRIKLYAVEINNTTGLDLKNNWVVSSRNYTENITSDGLYYNKNIHDYSSADAQRSQLVNQAIDSKMAQAVSLTGGLTGAANYLGRYFNAALTLNYLSSKGVANILDETTLLTLENQDATFHAGGTIYLKVQTTTDQGVPSTEIQNINYGLQLDIKAENIVNNEFVNLDITTKSTQIDWANTVDSIPSFTEKSIKTNVVVSNNATIILGGLISSNNSKDISKIPLLGDIPIIGFLFTSKAFREGKSELVFFITPEIIDPRNNNQLEQLDRKSSFTQELEMNKKEERAPLKEKKEFQPKESPSVTLAQNNSKELSPEERLNRFFGN